MITVACSKILLICTNALSSLVNPWVFQMKVKSTVNYHNVRNRGKNMPLPGTGPYMPLPGTGPY
jgi:hypothetical protein